VTLLSPTSILYTKLDPLFCLFLTGLSLPKKKVGRFLCGWYTLTQVQEPALFTRQEKTMRRLVRFILWIVVLMSLSGCGRVMGRFGLGNQPTPLAPTFDPTLLTVTPAPTSTPLPTYTPYPTTVRVPTDTPVPTFPPRLTVAATTPTPTHRPNVGPARPTSTPTLSLTDTGYVGIQGAGPEVADLAPILTIASEGATCDHDMLVQIGVINRGTGPAYNFTVEWSLGWSAEGPEVKSLFVPELQWGTIPLYIVNGMVRVPCQQTTVYTAFIRIDINNDVAELFEDNNNAEETYTILFFPPGG